MPRYFFNVHDGRDMPDETGTVVPDIKAARSQAVITAGERLRDLDGEFWGAPEWRMEVKNEHGAKVCAVVIHGEGAD